MHRLNYVVVQMLTTAQKIRKGPARKRHLLILSLMELAGDRLRGTRQQQFSCCSNGVSRSPSRVGLQTKRAAL